MTEPSYPIHREVFEATKRMNAEQIRDIFLTPENPTAWLPPIGYETPDGDAVLLEDKVYAAIRQHVEEFFVLGTEPDLDALIQYVQRVYDDGYEEGYDDGKSE